MVILLDQYASVITDYLHFIIKLVYSREIVQTAHFDIRVTLLFIHFQQLKLKRLINMLDLIVVRMRGAVRSQQAVDYKVAVIGHVAKVSSVGPELTVLKSQFTSLIT